MTGLSSIPYLMMLSTVGIQHTGLLTVELRRPENEFWVKLKPGRVGAKLEMSSKLFILKQ